MPHELFPFKLHDPRTGKWYRARWIASLEEIEKLGGEVDGPPEIREGNGYNSFSPFPHSQGAPNGNVDRAPGLDRDERYLVLLFLRRYVTWCARGQRYAAMQGAAQLFKSIRQPTSRRQNGKIAEA